MKKIANRFLAAVFSIYLLTATVFAAGELVPVGAVIGLELSTGSVTVAAFDDTLQTGRNGGLQIGDTIISIDGSAVASAEDVRRALNRSDGSVEITVSRRGHEKSVRLNPAITADGPRLGVYLRQGITGIGTVTWYNPDTGAFGTLGHGVSSGKGELLRMTSGKAYPATVVSVQKGKAGSPGQLKGALEAGHLLGTISANTSQGVFGSAPGVWTGQAIPVASFSDIHTGSAHIRSTIDGSTPRDYSVDILKIYPRTRSDSRNFLLRVTDPALLEATGGIVQGMGVSYNKDNQDNSLACRGVWCQSRFSLTTKIQAYQAQVCGTESTGFCDRDARAKSRQGGLYSSILDKQATTYSCHTGCRCRTGSVTPFGIFYFSPSEIRKTGNKAVASQVYLLILNRSTHLDQ